MQNTSERETMVCPLNGSVCKNGRREDFPVDEVGQKIQCRWWTHLYGKDPQSHKQIDQWDCAVAWLPTTTIETAQKAQQAAASFDKVANVTSELGNKFVQAVNIMLTPPEERNLLERKKGEQEKA